MSKLNFVYFSKMGEAEKAKINTQIDLAFDALQEIHDAPMASKENLMKTNFKAASLALTGIGRLLQAETAMAQAEAFIMDRAEKSDYFREGMSENLPEIKLPPKQLKK